jgi:RNA polymerase subunit RPABC4/transcription elongation factor Spt4
MGEIRPCKNCGAEVDPRSRVCPHCGKAHLVTEWICLVMFSLVLIVFTGFFAYAGACGISVVAATGHVDPLSRLTFLVGSAICLAVSGFLIVVSFRGLRTAWRNIRK